jgi:hypothetical protein
LPLSLGFFLVSLFPHIDKRESVALSSGVVCIPLSYLELQQQLSQSSTLSYNVA